MTEPLNYLPQPKEPPARWSWCAVLGFSLSLPGPFLGGLLAAAVNRISPGHEEVLLVFAIMPLVTGFTLSIIGAVITYDGSPRIRGRGFALAGATIAALWGILFALLFLMFAMNMHS